MFKPPKSIRAVFLLTCFKVLLAWTMFGVISKIGSDRIDPNLIMYTAAAYTVLAIATFVLIHKHSAIGVRVCIGLAILASIPASAFIGIVLDVAALALTFTKPAKAFFNSGEKTTESA